MFKITHISAKARTGQGGLRQAQQVHQQPGVPRRRGQVPEGSGQRLCDSGMQRWHPGSNAGRLVCAGMHNKFWSRRMASLYSWLQLVKGQWVPAPSLPTTAPHNVTTRSNAHSLLPFRNHGSPPCVDSTLMTTCCKCFTQAAAGRAGSDSHSPAAAARCSISTEATTCGGGKAGDL
jgi:hypothetical protein